MRAVYYAEKTFETAELEKRVIDFWTNYVRNSPGRLQIQIEEIWEYDRKWYLQIKVPYAVFAEFLEEIRMRELYDDEDLDFMIIRREFKLADELKEKNFWKFKKLKENKK